jgi:hypothetical protein
LSKVSTETNGLIHNAQVSIETTLLGSVINDNDEHPSNATQLIEVIPLPIIADDNDVHS